VSPKLRTGARKLPKYLPSEPFFFLRSHEDVEPPPLPTEITANLAPNYEKDASPSPTQDAPTPSFYVRSKWPPPALSVSPFPHFFIRVPLMFRWRPPLPPRCSFRNASLPWALSIFWDSHGWTDPRPPWRDLVSFTRRSRLFVRKDLIKNPRPPRSILLSLLFTLDARGGCCPLSLMVVHFFNGAGLSAFPLILQRIIISNFSYHFFTRPRSVLIVPLLPLTVRHFPSHVPFWSFVSFDHPHLLVFLRVPQSFSFALTTSCRFLLRL